MLKDKRDINLCATMALMFAHKKSHSVGQSVCVCVGVCVWERERGGERQWEKANICFLPDYLHFSSKNLNFYQFWMRSKHVKGSEEGFLLVQNTQSANLVGGGGGGNFLYQAAKQHLNKSENLNGKIL